MRRAALMTFALAAGLGVAVRPAWSSSIAGGGRIEKLVAGPDRIYAWGAGGVEVFDGEGRPLERCARFDAPLERAGRRPIGAPDPDEVLAAAGFTDDDDSSDAEDALEEEGIGAHPRRRALAGEVVEVRDLAAAKSDPGVWIATSAGLYRGGDAGCAPVSLRGRDLSLVAAAGTLVAAASEDLLWLFDGANPGIIVGLDRRPRALAVGDGPRILVGDDDGVVAVDAGGGTTRLLDQPVGAVVVCDGLALALASDGVYAWRADERPRRLSDRPPARRLACGPDGAARFVATGVGVWTSPDGVAWGERDETLGLSVTSAAATDRIWVAVEGELLALDDLEGASAGLSATSAGAPLVPSPPLPAPPTFPWPRLTVAFAAHETLAATAHQTAVRDGWSILVLVTVPLDRSERRSADAHGASTLAAERLERDAALAAESRRLSAPFGDGETEARLRALEQEREALR